MEGDLHVTRPHGPRRGIDPATVRRFRLTIVEGPQPGRVWESGADRCSLGSHALNDLVLDDETVSRFHCEVRIGKDGAWVKDLDSLNGVVVDGVQVREGALRGGSVLRLGRASVRFDFSAERNKLALSEATRFGSLVGTSVAMRACFARLERAATTDVTVLLEGETGTGKSQAAQAIHQAGARRDKPFLIVDCGAIPANLLESELFGHEKGSFTGAASRRVGAFEEAQGGTVFLDEIGEVPLELQAKLLRVLEERQIRRVGANAHIPVDVRIIAATHRDLRAEVNAGRFRSDLFFRLAVLRITLPSLRERPDDLPAITEQLLASTGADPERLEALRTPEFLTRLQQFAWPGNVRELRNYLERCLVFEDALPLAEEDGQQQDWQASSALTALPYSEARRRAIDDFERHYLQGLLEKHQGKVAQAAAAAQVDRVYFYRLMRRHNLKP
ncbi:sigma 54-interacting transcriptional regulator [Hyalangium sp.]|uniref:sigma 54-interacting transcriptional regulator n=1 Tax=Hyalangium sp. TaxID=2028555 RepID=UPI002D2983B5|nr:sigma 54-interacting transcriptional regulator [Hyalangium sp.]HYH99684.1 sigma 54-interacting transcriptional regulator [Hyalangium sp.]